jgi:hypothetical protein
MAVKCPKCGRPNPDEAYICQFCDAPLVIYTPPQIPDMEPGIPDDYDLSAEAVAPAAEPLPAEEEQPMDENHPDWLEHLRKMKEEDQRKLGDDFFNRYGSLAPDSPQQANGQTGNLDEWLSRIRSTRESEPVQAAEPAEEESIPSWLSTIRTKAVEEGLIENEPEPEPQAEDWLSKLRGSGETESATPLDEPLWNGEPILPYNPLAKPEEDILPARDLNEVTSQEPDFLHKLNSMPSYGQLDELHEERYSPYYDTDTPDEVENPIPEMLRNSIPQIDAEAFSEDVLPSEAQMLEMQDEPRERIPSKDIPKWLTSILGENEEEAAPLSAVAASQQSTTEPEPETQTGQELVEPAAIPGWVQAMRPIDRIGEPSEGDRLPMATGEGPLAGIRGILPGEGMMTSYTRVDGMSPGVRDRAKTAEHVALFNEMLATERQEVKVAGVQRGKTIGTVRWLMMVLLIFFMLVPILQGSAAESLPGSIPRESIALFKSITGLPADSKVLVAIDYEPAYAGELQAAASSVMNHLMVKQSNLYIISTTPTGPMLAGQLMDEIGQYPQAFQQPYVSGERYHIIGYLPGGEAGIQALNSSLTAVLPLTIGLEQTRDLNGLGGPAPISTFDAVLVIADQPETVRNWIEQINQTDGKPAIWAVVNAQAAPLLRPYVRSGQLEGLSAGEYGGTIYERIFQQPGVAWRHWNTFHTGVLTAAGLILVGGILNYAGQYILRNRRKKSA